MNKKNLSELDKKLLKVIPPVSEAIDQVIKEMIGEKFHFALLVYDGTTGTLAGSQNLEITLKELNRLIKHHQENGITTDDYDENGVFKTTTH